MDTGPVGVGPVDAPPWDVPTDGGPAPSAPSAPVAAARDAIQQTRPADRPREQSGPDWAAADADADPDDLDAEQQGLSTTELLQRELGAQMIEEIRHQ